MAKSKYSNKKITVNGITFDSKREYNRFCELVLLERAGQIQNLQMQVEFELIPTQREILPGVEANGTRKLGKVIERPCKYKADFVYTEKRII